jgi:hypothetical protein
MAHTRRLTLATAAAALSGALGLAIACGGTPSPSSPSGTGGFRVITATTSVDSAAFTGTCPHRFTFTATFTASAAGTATYQWERSDGSADATKALTFADAGSQTQTTTWDVGSGVNGGWMRVRVLGPNELLSNQATFTLTCRTVFAVTGLSVDPGPTTFAGTCPYTVAINGTMTTNGAGTVTYHWEHYNGTTTTNTASQALVFNAAGQQTVPDSWVIATSIPSTSWTRLHVDLPNDLVSNQSPVTVTCR